MPTFPSYRGQLPKCLNPLCLRHYFLLAYWVYFCPTALKCYLYRADPEIYRNGSDLKSQSCRLRIPAYRNLYLMVPGLSVLLSVLLGLPTVMASSWLLGVPANMLGWASGVTFGVAISAVYCVVGVMTLGLILGGPGIIAYGVGFSVVESVVGGVGGDAGLSVAFSLSLAVAVCVLLAVALGMVRDTTLGMSVGVTLGVVVLRVLFYPFELGLALGSALWKGRHPVEWDDLLVWPLPGTRQVLNWRLQQNQTNGLRLLANVARNPFQRWAAQRVLQAHLHKQAVPLHFLYELLTSPHLNEYIIAPVAEVHWQRVPTIRQLLLGELNRRWVDCNDPVARLVWRLTKLLRDRRQTPLTEFAGMLYQLLDERTVDAEDFNLFSYRKAYTNLTGYPGGVEIAQTFEAMATFLSYTDLSDLPAAVEVPLSPPANPVPAGFQGERNRSVRPAGRKAVPFPPCQRGGWRSEAGDRIGANDSAIRQPVLTALSRLKEVGAEVATYRDATSRVNKQAALLRATDALDALDECVAATVIAPEQTILRRIIRQWRRLVSEAGGEVGRAPVSGPVANPYVAGNPVTGDLFVGREDILRRLEELWAYSGQCPSVVLYGHRRMGKSSILRNLGARFGANTAVVDFNMQRVGLVASTGELLYSLSLALYDSLSRPQQEELGEPAEDRFNGGGNPYTAFDRFLKQLDGVRSGLRFIVTVDEFEIIEQLIEESRLAPRLLDFWRALIQTYPWFVMAFAGLHNLEEMRHDYWNPLFGSVTAIPVSFLSPKAAERLIAQPSPDFDIDYDLEAVQRIVELTNGQPYLVQLIGHALVTRFNRQNFEEGRERERRFKLEEVEAVINSPEFYRDGNAYFNGVWVQAQSSPPKGQLDILLNLCYNSLSQAELVSATALTPEQVRAALETLQRHDVIVRRGERYFYTVELMRRWVERRETK